MRRRARVRGSEPGFQAGQLEAGGTTRPEEEGGDAARRGRGLRRRSWAVRARETRRPQPLSPPLPSHSAVPCSRDGELGTGW